MSDVDVTAGLVLPNAAVALHGKGGAVVSLLLVFMAVISASSTDYIAICSSFTCDIYQTYFDPKASSRKLIYMAHLCVVIYAIWLAAFSAGAILYILHDVESLSFSLIALTQRKMLVSPRGICLDVG